MLNDISMVSFEREDEVASFTERGFVVVMRSGSYRLAACLTHFEYFWPCLYIVEGASICLTVLQSITGCSQMLDS